MKTHAQKNKAKNVLSNSSNRAKTAGPRQLLALAAMIALLSATMGLSSCAGYTTNAAGTTGSQGGSATGTLSASSTNLSFGGVVVGSSSTLSLTVTNTGTATVNISQAAISGAAFSIVGGNPSSTIPAGQSSTVQVRFAPQSAGAATGSLTVTSDATDSPMAVSLAGTGTLPTLTLSPTALNFNNVTIGQTSSESVSLINNGNANLLLTAATVTGNGFAISGLSLPKTLPAGQSITLGVQFTPTSARAASGSVSFTDNAASSPQTLLLTGSAVAAPQLSISPSSVAFSNVNVGGNATKTVTVSNTGNVTLNITAASISGSGYTMTFAPTTINAGANTTFSVAFAPTVEGSAAGNISITSNSPGSPASVALSGTGMQALGSANPASIAFGNVVVGNNNSDVISLKNTGNSTLSFSQVNVSGSGFSISGLTTSTTIAAGASLNFNAAFAPTSANPSSGTITLSTNGSPAQISIPLNGTGTSATESLSSSSSSLSFGNVQVGNTNTLTATLTNTGNANVTISGVTVTGTGYTTSGITSGMILTPNQTATLTVNFAPTGLGSDPGSVSIASDATSSPAISLTGESHTVLLSWTASTSTGVTGYYVYRGTQSGQYTKVDPSSQATGTQFTDTTVAAGTTYYYVVTSVADGVESSYSSPTNVSVP
ncbi:MAG: beta strand repeat-containing protein [Candidatus Acidiferrales bacterium]